MNKKKSYYNQRELIKRHWWGKKEYKDKIVEVKILGSKLVDALGQRRYLIELPNKTRLEVWEFELYFTGNG